MGRLKRRTLQCRNAVKKPYEIKDAVRYVISSLLHGLGEQVSRTLHFLVQRRHFLLSLWKVYKMIVFNTNFTFLQNDHLPLYFLFNFNHFILSCLRNVLHYFFFSLQKLRTRPLNLRVKFR